VSTQPEDTQDDLESVELEDHDIEDDPSYERFDCTGGDAAGNAAAVDAARRAVSDGECIVLPTDTVYGIGADAFNADAVQRLLDAKMRGRDMPPPVLIADASLIRALATGVPDPAKDLVALHWPGPLTVICKIQPSLRMDLGDTEGTIALRVPDHELAREILRRTGPMAVSSANLSGKPAALSCDEAVDQLGDRVAVYLDGGSLSATAGAPSTIVDFTQRDQGEVLRRGALGLDVLRQTLPGLVDRTGTEDEATPTEPEEPASATQEPAAAAEDDPPPAAGG
jgi:L-threonylcarbamoyladenylate synthase